MIARTYVHGFSDLRVNSMAMCAWQDCPCRTQAGTQQTSSPQRVRVRVGVKVGVTSGVGLVWAPQKTYFRWTCK